MPLYMESESTLAVSGLKDAAGATITDATVTVEITRPGSGEVMWSGTLTADGAGAYEAVLPYPLPDVGGEARAFTLGEIVRIRYRATSGTVDRTWYEDQRIRRGRP